MKRVTFNLKDDEHAWIVSQAKEQDLSIQKLFNRILKDNIANDKWDNNGLLDRLTALSGKERAETLFLCLVSAAKSKGLDVSNYD